MALPVDAGFIVQQLFEFLTRLGDDPVADVDPSRWRAPSEEDLEAAELLELTGFFQEVALLFATLLIIAILFFIGTGRFRGIQGVTVLVKFVFGIALIANSTDFIFLLYGTIDGLIDAIQAIYIDQTARSIGSELVGYTFLLGSIAVNPATYLLALALGFIADLALIGVLLIREVVLTAFVPVAPLLIVAWMVSSILGYNVPGVSTFLRAVLFPIPMIILLATVEIITDPSTGSLIGDGVFAHSFEQALASILVLGVIYISIKMSGVTKSVVGAGTSVAKKGAFLGAAAATGGGAAAGKAALGAKSKSEVASNVVDQAPSTKGAIEKAENMGGKMSGVGSSLAGGTSSRRAQFLAGGDPHDTDTQSATSRLANSDEFAAPMVSNRGGISDSGGNPYSGAMENLDEFTKNDGVEDGRNFQPITERTGYGQGSSGPSPGDGLTLGDTQARGLSTTDGASPHRQTARMPSSSSGASSSSSASTTASGSSPTDPYGDEYLEGPSASAATSDSEGEKEEDPLAELNSSDDPFS